VFRLHDMISQHFDGLGRRTDLVASGDQVGQSMPATATQTAGQPAVTTYLCSNVSIIAQRSVLDITAGKRMGILAGRPPGVCGVGRPSLHTSAPGRPRGEKLAFETGAGNPPTHLPSKNTPSQKFGNRGNFPPSALWRGPIPGLICGF
jgi:hypothetical protein